MLSDTEWLLAGMDRVLAPVATPLGFVLAVMVTGHAILNKRDVPACIGWIGLAWIAPTWGALFYLLFGINRVARRAKSSKSDRQPRNLASGPNLQEVEGDLALLGHAVRRLTNRSLARNNKVTVLQNGDEAYPAMLAAIGDARRSIALSTYIMRDDAVGALFVEALAAAHQRGVEVRIILDGMGSGYFPSVYGRLRGKGLPVALFMHSMLPWRMPFLNLRCHKKLLVVDGAKGFTGGINIAAENVLAGASRVPVADTHFELSGPVVAQLMDAFAQDWAFTAGEDLEGDVWFPAVEDHGTVLARVIASGPDQDLDGIHAVLLEAIACSRTAIKIMTPYFLPSEDLVMALTLAAVRGIKVDIIVPKRSNHRFVDLAMHAHVGPMLDRGVRIWLGPEPFDHSKLVVVDHEWCLVGSANWDLRSLRLNFELNVELYSADLAVKLEAIMKKRQEVRLRSRDLNARSLPVRLRDAGLRLLLPYI